MEKKLGFVFSLVFLMGSLPGLTQDLVFFDGAELTTGVTLQVDWSGSVEISDEDDAGDDGYCIKLTTGSGWDGMQLVLDPPESFDTWSLDTLIFNILYDSDIVGDLTVWFIDMDEDGAEKEDYGFAATYFLTAASVGFSDDWVEIKLPLSEFNLNNGIWDNDLAQQIAGTMDPGIVEKLLITGMGQTEWEDNIIYFDDIRVVGPKPTGVSGSGMTRSPNQFTLDQNYPNPFNPETRISYQLPQAGQVRLLVFDLLGREVKTLVDEKQPAGLHDVRLNARDLDSGVYFYRLEAEDFTATRKMLLVE